MVSNSRPGLEKYLLYGKFEIFIQGWNFISGWLNQVEIWTRYTEFNLLHINAMSFQREVYYLAKIKFQLGIPSWNFKPGWKSPYNQPLSMEENVRPKNGHTQTQVLFCKYCDIFKKHKCTQRRSQDPRKHLRWWALLFQSSPT